MKRFLSPVQSFLQQAFVQVSKADGKPGLTLADIEVVIQKVRYAQNEFDDEGQGILRAQSVREALLRLFPNKFPTWVADILVWIAYALAKRRGLI